MNQNNSPKWPKFVVGGILATLLFICGANTAFSQSIPPETAKTLDSMFKQWDNKKSPGGIIVVLRNDSLIYAKACGVANQEYGIPITTQTIFEMGSVSKQFTAYAILLLAHQGKLSVDDDIHKYLPWLPNFGKKITICNLLYHTSGIRDYDQLLSIAGTTGEDIITREHLVKILSKQQTLNFDPGAQYMYSNSGYFLLGEIVRSVMGKSLRRFTDSAVFKPLGMINTHFHDNYTEVVPNRAYPYTQPDTMDIVNSSVVGAKGLMTNIDDMCKWAMNFLNDKSDSHLIIEQMKQSGKLSSGKETGVGAGLQTWDYRGLKLYFHPGIDNGYDNMVTFIPQKKMAIIMFSNRSDHYAFDERDQMVGLFIKDPSPEKTKAATRLRGDSLITDTASLKAFLGPYITDDGQHAVFKLKNGKFYYANYGTDFLLLRTARDSFYYPGYLTGIKYVFNEKDPHHITIRQIWPDGGFVRTMRKYDPNDEPTDKQLLAYTGKYYCPELDCAYGIILKDHQLVLTNAKYPDSPLEFYSPTRMINTMDWMKSLDFTKNKKGKITGFEINYDMIQDLRFEKIE